jgi:hypothetical protein
MRHWWNVTTNGSSSRLSAEECSHESGEKFEHGGKEGVRYKLPSKNRAGD